nr:hypothetical protein [Tanacetum cinerariifolium]
LPVKYMGVPLVSSRLVYKDCRESIEKVCGRVMDWKNKSLSAAGLLKKGKAKVSWDVVCRMRIEGGLGIRRFDLFNKALMLSHLWNLISLKESLWVKWIHVRQPGLIRGVISGRFLGLFHLEIFIEHVMIWILRLEWRTNSGLVKPFSISNVWNSIRP